jgi:hypothetical protein
VTARTELVGIDADRKRGAPRLPKTPPTSRRHRAVLHGKTEILADKFEEIFAILVSLETDQVIGQHRVDQFAVMRNACDDVARRPRRVQEEADWLGDAELPQLRAEREEMIVLHPECGIPVAKAQQRARHEGVDLAIGEIIALRGANQVAARMQCRPQRRIGEAFIEAAIMRRRQVQHRDRARAERFDFGERLLLQAVTQAAA